MTPTLCDQLVPDDVGPDELDHVGGRAVGSVGGIAEDPRLTYKWAGHTHPKKPKKWIGDR